MQGKVLFEQRGSVAWISIHNPAKRNAVSLAMWQELSDVLNRIGDDVRCIVVRGQGDKAFAAGADISEFGTSRRSPSDVAAYDVAADEAMARLSALPQPTIAMISGYCIGGGMALALCCDIRQASTTAQFAIPAARLGLGYGVPHVRRLVDAVGASHAMEMIATARRYDAQDALRIGLVNGVAPSDNFETAMAHYAATIADNAPLTIRAFKHAVRGLQGYAPDGHLVASSQLAAACFASDDYAEGVRAFGEKREPMFTGN